MKLHVETSIKSLGVRRVVDELKKKYGDHSYEDSDIVVMHVNGRLEKNLQKAENILKDGKQYIVVQYALKSTQKPKAADWIKLWRGARFVWSYYNIAAICKEEGITVDFRTCETPLGTRFEGSPKEQKNFIVTTSGLDYLTESVKECVRAAKDCERRVFHVGPNLRIQNIIYSDGLPDSELIRHYEQCEFASGLRRIEGFELPAIEGLMCGARPIVFNQPHYKKWYGNFAEYIDENDRESVYRDLYRLFKKGARPVTKDEIDSAKKLFNWDLILDVFNSTI